MTLAEGLQNALWSLDGVPQEHRSDSLSAAFRNLDRDAREDLTRRYEELCAHYGRTPSRNNASVAHENGAIESSQGHLKRAIENALLMRGTHDQVVNYRHVIHSPRKKTMALLNLIYRDQMFPREAYRRTFDLLIERLPRRQACRTIIELLGPARESGGESQLADGLTGASLNQAHPDC